jgi:hypothetical protein
VTSGSGRWCVLALAALATTAALLSPHGAAAGPPRPYDAPAVDVQRTPVPEVTPDYDTSEEAGVKLVSHPTVGARAHTLLARALAVRTELSAELGRDVLGSVEIRVAGAPVQVAGLSPGALPPGASSGAFAGARLVVMSLGAPGALEPTDLDERLRHELAHLALDEAAHLDAAHDVPRWFHEGYALHVSGEDAAQRAEALTLASLRDQLLSLEDVDARFPEGPPGASLTAAEAADFVRFLIEPPRGGRDAFPAFVERLREGEAFEGAIVSAYGADLRRVELSWRREVAKRYGFVPVFAGATLLWMVVALGVMVQNRRIAARRVRVSENPLPAAERLHAREPDHPRLPAEEDDLAQAIPPDPEVPKIEHGGRWYTLH